MLTPWRSRTHLIVCLSVGRAVFLAALAGLHNHVGQLLHLKGKTNSRVIHLWLKCCFHIKCSANISPWNEGYLAAASIPCVACPRSRGWAVAPVSVEHSKAGQRLLGCDACTGPKSVNNYMRGKTWRQRMQLRTPKAKSSFHRRWIYGNQLRECFLLQSRYLWFTPWTVIVNVLQNLFNMVYSVHC